MFTKENFEKLLNQAQNMQKNMEKIRTQVKNIVVKGESGAGLVKVYLNGLYHCQKIKIDNTLFNITDKKVTIDLIIAAFNQAIQKILETQTKNIIKK
ncbi:YbaB/EbfC family nucleoid-associated protein [Buchnera aphidicola]|uniref:Nucleoid-associated protein BTSPAZIEG_0323 n=1 Tax=Buchnera aphidicola subsp. Tuberolachnus salignus TaxID=98804 RepID=A0A160SZA5_BUCTT|nr:YbaB/EbfC family nucleoid-associated protein [Buchnera aphidicola]CUR53286.1 Nucleoid-associated protein YbaB [Buchnera aphidicola (Tuberolachnus salignus)]